MENANLGFTVYGTGVFLFLTNSKFFLHKLQNVSNVTGFVQYSCDWTAKMVRTFLDHIITIHGVSPSSLLNGCWVSFKKVTDSMKIIRKSMARGKILAVSHKIINTSIM
jgi:hypothetical protein